MVPRAILTITVTPKATGINPCQRNNGVEDRDEHDLHSGALKEKSAREEDQVDNHHNQNFAVQSAAEEAPG